MYERLKPVKGGICIFESFLLRVEVGDAWYYSIWFWKRKRGEEYFVVKAIETSVEWPLCHAHIVRSSKPIDPIGYRLVDRPCIPSILDFIPTPVERIGSIETVGDRLLCDEIPIQRYRANNSPPCRKCGRLCSKKRRLRGTGSAGTLLFLLLCIYLRDCTKDCTIFMAVKGQWNWNWRKPIDWKLLDWREINFRLLNIYVTFKIHSFALFFKII